MKYRCFSVRFISQRGKAPWTLVDIAYIMKKIEDFAVDYWYDEGVDIAENMLCKFEENDWEVLLEVVSERTVEWQKRLAYCMHDKSDLNQLKVLLSLVETDDSELFEIVVDSLRGFTSEESLNLIQTDSRIVSKIEELMPKVGDATKRVFEEFLKNSLIGNRL